MLLISLIAFFHLLPVGGCFVCVDGGGSCVCYGGVSGYVCGCGSARISSQCSACCSYLFSACWSWL